MAFLLSLPGGAQTPAPPSAPSTLASIQSFGGPPSDINNNVNAFDYEHQLAALNAERQKKMVSDTNKLLKLANELDAEVRLSGSGALTAAQLHKVAEIEKLARSVKDKMSTSIRGPLDVSAPYIPPPHR
jgi:hypothetical protein